VDWGLEKKNAGLVRFVTQLIALRKKYFALSREQFMDRAVWHGLKVNEPDWTGQTRTLALQLLPVPGQPAVHVLFNAHWEPKRFALPDIDGHYRWKRLVDTNLPAPDDVVEEKVAVPLNPGDHYIVSPRSVVVLLG